MDTFIPVGKLEWKTTKINRYIQEGPEEKHKYRFEIELFEPYASWDALDMWEDERLASMQKHIKQKDILFEVGAEMGLFPAIFSKYMTENIVLFEPTAEFWPGIKAIYERNNLKAPMHSFCGFLSDKDDPYNKNVASWPDEAFQEDVIEKRKYRNLHDKDDISEVRFVRLDSLVFDTTLKPSMVPDHISIDVEGAELKVLLGAEKTLKKHRPLVWCSIHPDLIERNYNATREDVLWFMDDCGYEAELLAVDHEEHWLFTPKK